MLAALLCNLEIAPQRVFRGGGGAKDSMSIEHFDYEPAIFNDDDELIEMCMMFLQLRTPR